MYSNRVLSGMRPTGALHLGQPLKAWRSFLGWRKSWFSREVIVFGAFGGSTALLVALAEWAALPYLRRATRPGAR